MFKNRIWKILFVVSILAFVAKIITYNQPAQFFANIPLLFASGVLMLKFRKEIDEKIKKLNLPKIVLAVLSAVPIMILEENINCPPTGCRFFPETIPVLTIFIFLFIAVVLIFKIKGFYKTILLFSALGFLNEYFQGYMSAQLHSILFTPAGLIVFVFTVLSYAYIAIIPLTIAQE